MSFCNSSHGTENFNYPHNCSASTPFDDLGTMELEGEGDAVPRPKRPPRCHAAKRGHIVCASLVHEVARVRASIDVRINAMRLVPRMTDLILPFRSTSTTFS